MIKHLIRIDYAPLRIVLLLAALPFAFLGLIRDVLLNDPRELFAPSLYVFVAKSFCAAMAGKFVPKP